MKPWYTSKTIWFNALLLALSWAVDADVSARLRELGMPEQIVLQVAAVGNLGLRLISVGRVVWSARA